MKMGSGMFWGILLIVIGISLIVKIVFNIDFPIIRVILAFVLIYFGIKLLVGFKGKPFCEHKTETEVIFGKSEFNSPEGNREYSIVFGKGVFDLRQYKLNENGPTKIKVNTAFGNTTILIPTGMQFTIQVDAAFSGVTLPNGNTSSFGETSYSTADFDRSLPYLDIEADVAFGALEVRYN